MSEPERTPADDPEMVEAGRRLFAQNCTFVAGVVSSDGVPPSGQTEIAFAGRSNVGKSSLVNALTGRTTLARVSNTPGRTQQLNFFDLGGRLGLVDLPGYGYAEAPQSAKKVWTKLTLDYLKGRANLRRVLLLIDARHGIKAVDREIMKTLDESAVSYQGVLTKADKVPAAMLAAVIAAVEGELKRHVAAHPRLMVTSSREGSGIPELRAELVALVGQ